MSSRRMCVFVPEPEPEESYVSKVFAKMEKDSQIQKKEATALYPEEEVIVKASRYTSIHP